MIEGGHEQLQVYKQSLSHYVFDLCAIRPCIVVRKRKKKVVYSIQEGAKFMTLAHPLPQQRLVNHTEARVERPKGGEGCPDRVELYAARLGEWTAPICRFYFHIYTSEGGGDSAFRLY